jgi:hypothetical protein
MASGVLDRHAILNGHGAFSAGRPRADCQSLQGTAVTPRVGNANNRLDRSSCEKDSGRSPPAPALAMLYTALSRAVDRRVSYAQRLLPVSFGAIVISSFGIRTALPR